MASFNALMKKITNRHFVLEGKLSWYTEEPVIRYIGFRDSRTNDFIHSSGNQDINVDVTELTKHVYTEIDSHEVDYYLTDEEYNQFITELKSRII